MVWTPQVQRAIWLRSRGWNNIQAGGRKAWVKGRGETRLVALSIGHAETLEHTLCRTMPLAPYMWGADIAELLTGQPPEGPEPKVSSFKRNRAREALEALDGATFTSTEERDLFEHVVAPARALLQKLVKS